MKGSKEFIFYIAVCVGMAISSTSFTIISGLNEIMSGGWVILSVAIGGILCLGVSRLIAELASMYPSAPGIRTYLLRGFSNEVSLFFVFLYIIFVLLIGSIESYMFALVIQSAFPNVPTVVTIVSLIASVIFVNCIGFELPRNIQIISASILALGVLTFGTMAILNAETPLRIFQTFQDSHQILLLPASIGLSIFLFMGFEWATSLGLNSKAYLKKIPYAMQGAIVINALVYTVFCWGLSASISQQSIGLSKTPHILLAQFHLGEVGLYLGLLLSFLAIIATFNAGVMGGARFLYTVAREGYLPPFVAKISIKHSSPIGAVLLLGALVLINSLVVSFYELEILFALISASIICFVYAALLLALIRIKASNKEMKINYEAKLPVWVPQFLILILVVFGTLTLFSIPKSIVPALIGMLSIIFFARVASILSLRFKEKNKLKKEKEKKLEPV